MGETAGQVSDATVRLIQTGNLDAFGEVVDKYQREIRAWLISRCPPGCDPDDVAQNTFVKAFQGIGRFEAGTDFRAWLFAIARCQLLAECARMRRLADYHSRYAIRALVDELERRSLEPTERSQERLGHLEDCLKELCSLGQELLNCRYRDGISLQEIASRTGRSLGSVKKQLLVFRRKLHACIERKLAGDLSSMSERA